MRIPSIPFGVKAGAGMLTFAMAPCYCVYALANVDKEWMDADKERRRKKLERELRIDNPFPVVPAKTSDSDR